MPLSAAIALKLLLLKTFNQSHIYSTLSESIFYFGKLMPVFYPVFHIAAIAADITDHWDFPNQGHGRGVDIVSAGVSARIIRHTHDIL